MGFADATAQLMGLSFTGLANHYDFVELPAFLAEADLPALLITLDDTYQDAVKPHDANLTYGQINIAVNHILLITGFGQGRIQDRRASVATWLDEYVDTISTDWKLDDNLLYPMKVNVMKIGDIEWAGGLYTGIEFLHQWTLRI